MARKFTFVRGFTLVELLVVVAIIALLLGVLLPALGQARKVAVVSTCMANQRQLGTAIVTYEVEYGAIPHGPNVPGNPPFVVANPGNIATSQLWTGPIMSPPQAMALGLLLSSGEFNAKAFYCPGDNTNNREAELPKLLAGDTTETVFGSYSYRQLDQMTGTGKLSSLGFNDRGGRAAALAFDLNSTIAAVPGYARSNHEGTKVNVLYADTSVATVSNEDDTYSLRDQDLQGDPFLTQRLDVILQDLDATY